MNKIILFFIIFNSIYFSIETQHKSRHQSQFHSKFTHKHRFKTHKLHKIVKSQVRMRAKFTMHFKHRIQDLFKQYPQGSLKQRMWNLQQEDPQNAVEMSPENAQNMRSSDWDFWEQQANLPKYYFGDICDMKREGETIQLQCSDLEQLGAVCPGGEINEIYTGFYGSVQGECPSFSHTWKCVKEVQGVLDDDEFGKYNCKNQQACQFVVDPNEYKMVPWSTWQVNANGGPLNHDPNLNGCEQVQEQKLAVVASCKCTNPIDQQESEPPPLGYDEYSSDPWGYNSDTSSNSRSQW